MDALSDAVIAILRRHLPPEGGAAPADPDALLSACGLDSLKTVEFILDLERCLSIRLPPEAMIVENFQTVRTVVQTVHRIRGRSV
jgi:acyl carrier protein